jgi:hypothetical protein
MHRRYKGSKQGSRCLPALYRACAEVLNSLNLDLSKALWCQSHYNGTWFLHKYSTSHAVQLRWAVLHSAVQDAASELTAWRLHS